MIYNFIYMLFTGSDNEFQNFFLIVTIVLKIIEITKDGGSPDARLRLARQ